MQIFITGGTLDKDYHPIQGQLTFEKTQLPEMLNQANLTQPTSLSVLMLKDSLDMSDADRQIITESCLSCNDHKILITHGTDTMPITAATLLKHHSQMPEKTIVLTGAMRPFALGNSDAMFNLGSAIMALNLTRPGVYIAMNGQLFEAGKVTKNTQKGLFEVTPTDTP